MNPERGDLRDHHLTHCEEQPVFLSYPSPTHFFNESRANYLHYFEANPDLASRVASPESGILLPQQDQPPGRPRTIQEGENRMKPKFRKGFTTPDEDPMWNLGRNTELKMWNDRGRPASWRQHAEFELVREKMASKHRYFHIRLKDDPPSESQRRKRLKRWFDNDGKRSPKRRLSGWDEKFLDENTMSEDEDEDEMPVTQEDDTEDACDEIDAYLKEKRRLDVAGQNGALPSVEVPESSKSTAVSDHSAIDEDADAEDGGASLSLSFSGENGPDSHLGKERQTDWSYAIDPSLMKSFTGS